VERSDLISGSGATSPTAQTKRKWTRMLETLWHFLDSYSAADLDDAFSPLDHFAIDARGIRIGASEDCRNSGHKGRRAASSQTNTPARERRAALSMLSGYTAPGFHHTHLANSASKFLILLRCAGIATPSLARWTILVVTSWLFPVL